MIDCDSNFTKAKNIALIIVSEGDTITWTLILFKTRPRTLESGKQRYAMESK
jgi:hypothetical protein